MARVRIIPVLLLGEGGLYKTIKFKSAKYVGDPINTVKIFNEKEVDELVVLGFDTSRRKGSIDYKKIEEIAGEAFMPMAYGGGIKSLDDAKRVFDAGYEKVILNSILYQDLSILDSIAGIFGAQAVVGSIDAKPGLLGTKRTYSLSGSKKTGKNPVEWARVLEESGCGEILINSISQDGTWDGYDYQLVGQVANAVTVPVIACGGAGAMEHFELAINAGVSAVAAGSMFVYQKKGMGVLINFPTGHQLYKKV